MKHSAGGVVVRRAQFEDVEPIVRLIGAFADDALMLRRTPEMVELAIDDYVVAVDAWGRVVGCGALKEYSPSVAEVAAIAVSRGAHGQGVGRAIVAAVETLAIKRGTVDVFALTLQPAFFAAIGYQRVDRARYPEKIRRDCLACARRFACDEYCFAKNLQIDSPMIAEGRALGDAITPSGSPVTIAPRRGGHRQVA